MLMLLLLRRCGRGRVNGRGQASAVLCGRGSSGVEAGVEAVGALHGRNGRRGGHCCVRALLVLAWSCCVRSRLPVSTQSMSYADQGCLRSVRLQLT
jgi:hypothetical protein